MNLIIDKRGTGKTIKLLELSEETKMPLVCKPEDFEDLHRYALESGYDIPTPLTYKDYISSQLNATEVLLDDISSFVEYITKYYNLPEVSTATVNSN